MPFPFPIGFMAGAAAWGPGTDSTWTVDYSGAAVEFTFPVGTVYGVITKVEVLAGGGGGGGGGGGASWFENLSFTNRNTYWGGSYGGGGGEGGGKGGWAYESITEWSGAGISFWVFVGDHGHGAAGGAGTTSSSTWSTVGTDGADGANTWIKKLVNPATWSTLKEATGGEHGHGGGRCLVTTTPPAASYTGTGGTGGAGNNGTTGGTDVNGIETNKADRSVAAASGGATQNADGDLADGATYGAGGAGGGGGTATIDLTWSNPNWTKVSTAGGTGSTGSNGTPGRARISYSYWT